MNSILTFLAKITHNRLHEKCMCFSLQIQIKLDKSQTLQFCDRIWFIRMISNTC